MTVWRRYRPASLLAVLGLLLALFWMFSPSKLPAQAQSQSVFATQDTYLKKGSPNQNQGAETILRIRSSGKNRTLVQFDQADIAAAVGIGPLTSAKLRLTIVFNGNNWGATGRGVGVHRMTQAWTELGATFNCPDDTNTGNSSPDCTEWVMNDSSQWPFLAAPTAVVLHQNQQAGVVEWDVTADVAAFLAGTATNNGWIIKKADEGQSGHVQYSSREGAFAPELVLTVGGPAPPPMVTIQDTYLLKGQPNKNKGSEVILRLKSSGNNRALVQFDQADIAAAVGSGILTSAKLRLTIVLNGNNWGASGRDVAVHRMTQAWSEIGATWKCSDDLNTQNSAPDCPGAEWEMTNSSLWPFEATPTALALHEKNQTGPVEWDVTADVAAFLAGTATNHGWLVKKVEEGQSGKVEYSSREGTAPPELLINATSGAALVGVDPATGTQGETLTVTLTGSNTSFDVTTEATFGPNIQVGGGLEGDFGTVAVTSATSATANLTISATAALGPRTVTARTNTEQVSKADAFTVFAPGTVAIAETTVTTIAGASTPGFTDGQGVLAQFDNPQGMARDAAGNLYVADTNNHSIRKIAPDGAVTTLAGSGTPGLADGTGTAAQFDSPQGVAGDSSGTVYVADTANHVIRQIATNGTVTTLAGTGVAGFLDGSGLSAQFNLPRSVALRSDGLLVVGDEGNSRVRLVDPLTGQVSTLAGSGTPGFLDGAATVAQFASLAGVASDGADNVYVADTDNQRIRKIAASDGTVSTFAGTGDFGFLDGAALSAQFADPSGVTVDSAGNVYVADSFNSLIRRITPAGQVDTVAGTGVRGADDGPGTTASFRTPQALVTGSQVFIADTGNHLIRLLQIGPIITGIDPTSGVQDSTFTLTVSGTNLGGATALTFLNGGTADTDLTATNLSVDPSGTTLTASVTIAPTATIGTRIVTVTTPGGTSSDVASPSNTFTVLGKLVLTPDPFTVKQGQTALLTVSILNAAPAGGIGVTLESAGPAIATVTSPVTIASGTTSATATVTGVSEAITNITASATGFADAIVGVNVTAPTPTITDFDPGAGEVGDTVTITGTGFRTTLSENAVTFTGPNDTRVSTPVTSATSTQLVVTVPAGGVTGPLEMTTAGGTATSTGHFIVLPSPDFTLNVAPGTADVVQGSQLSFSISATGEEGFSGLVSLTATLPTGLTGSFSPAQIGPGGTATLTVTTAAGASSGGITITGTSVINGVVVGRQQTVNITVLAGGVTRLVGRVLDTDSKPVQGVTLTLGGQSTTTDSAGNFRLDNVPAGADQFLFIDGATAVPDRKFPTFPALVTIVAGQVNTLPFTPFMHPQKATGFVDISNSGVERIVTDPDLPGFEMRIPAGVTITGWDDQLNTKVSVRTVPIDRLPLPHPDPPIAARSVYMFYFDKVGGGTPTQPVPVTAANDLGLEPGAQAELWYYDEGPTPGSATQRWQMAGTATVSADGKTISTDPGVGLPRFCCGAFCFAAATNPSLASQSPVPEGQRGGEPVDLATGLFVLEKTDMVLPGRLPIALTRTYRTNDTTQGPFGTGTSAFFSEVLQAPTPESLIYVQPGNTRIPFALQPDGTFINDTIPSFRGAKIISNPDGTRTLRFRDGSTRLFEPATAGLFQLKAITDRNGSTNTIVRDGQGRPVTLVEPGGRALQISYVGNILISSVRDPIGREVQYSYDANNRLETVTDPAGGVTTYTYDTNNNLLTITDPRQITFLTNEFSASGRVIRQVQADGGEWGFAYMVSGAQVTGPGCPGPTCPLVESLEKIQQGFSFTGGFVVVTTVTDPRGNSTTYRFNNFGYPIEVIDPLGQSTKFERAEVTNLLLSTTDPLGRVTSFTYDANGNVTSITDPAGNVRSFEYEPTFNRLTKITDPLNNVTQFAYDANGNLTTITDPLNNITQITYDAFGQPISTTDPLSNVTQFEYDEVGNLTGVVDPLGNTTTQTYDLVSRLIAQADPRGKTSRFTYDELNRLTQIIDALNELTAFSYDENGNLLTVTDARGNTTTHTYDVMDRLETRTDPLNRSEGFSYDPNGNLTQFTDRKVQLSTFTYDPLNRRTRSDFADGTFTEFTFDAIGRLFGASDSQTGTIVEEYDVLDRLIRETTPQGTISYAYDTLGRRTSMTVDGQSRVSYTYDSASRLRTITQSSFLSPVTIDYDALGRRTLLTLPNGVSTEYQYDVASRLTALIYRNAVGVLGDLQYTYDAAGNRVRVGGSFARTLLPDPVLSSSYDAANQQLAFGDKSMTFDVNGNLETLTDTAGTTSFTWDARNRLIGLASPGTTASFAYDVLGRRVGKEINGQLNEHLYDGTDIIRELINGSSVPYLRSLDIDEPFTRNATEFYLTDGLGSVLSLTDSTGALTTQYVYDPFGVSMVEGTVSANRFQYAGRENDGTGLYYYRARYYSQQLHRFVTEDPMGFKGGDTNLFAYAFNNPVNLTDPFGLRVIFLNRPVSDPETRAKLDALDEAVGDRDVIVTSGDRTPEEQKRINPKAPNSLHVKGKAADVVIPGLSSEEVAQKAAEVTFKGISTYSKSRGGHTHVDTRRREWNAHNGGTLPYKPKWRIEGERTAKQKTKMGGRK